MRSSHSVLFFMSCLVALSSSISFADDDAKHVLLVAGKPSHPPRMHEFNAGVQLLAQCLNESGVIKADYVLNGWPEDESIFERVDAIVFYMDGGGGHEVVKEDGRRLKLIDGMVQRGVSLGFMHYGVEVVPEQAGEQFKRWIGGHYEHMFSCNPIWSPRFDAFPEHPVTNGVQPFTAKDEWYFNMRFISDAAGNELTGNTAAELPGGTFTPILVGLPSNQVRNGPYVYPAGPYPHIQANAGRAEAMMWVVEYDDQRRGMGFTGGHFHDNWGDDNFRKVVLNSLVWLTHAEVPAEGVASSVTPAQLDANLDPKNR